eukprot:EST45950.1 Hypothetical protein SS50377_13929 [Spironucleus salmonicida]
MLETVIHAYKDLKAEVDANAQVQLSVSKLNQSFITSGNHIQIQQLLLENSQLKYDRDIMAQKIMDLDMKNDAVPDPLVLQNDILYYQQQLISLNKQNSILKNQIIDLKNNQGTKELQIIDKDYTDIYQAQNPFYMFLVLKLLQYNSSTQIMQVDQHVLNAFDIVESAGYSETKQVIQQKITLMGEIERKILKQNGIY